jgi:hypothetical protein
MSWSESPTLAQDPAVRQASWKAAENPVTRKKQLAISQPFPPTLRPDRIPQVNRAVSELAFGTKPATSRESRPDSRASTGSTLMASCPQLHMTSDDCQAPGADQERFRSPSPNSVVTNVGGPRSRHVRLTCRARFSESRGPAAPAGYRDLEPRPLLRKTKLISTCRGREIGRTMRGAPSSTPHCWKNDRRARVRYRIYRGAERGEADGPHPKFGLSSLDRPCCRPNGQGQCYRLSTSRGV